MVSSPPPCTPCRKPWYSLVIQGGIVSISASQWRTRTSLSSVSVHGTDWSSSGALSSSDSSSIHGCDCLSLVLTILSPASSSHNPPSLFRCQLNRLKVASADLSPTMLWALLYISKNSVRDMNGAPWVNCIYRIDQSCLFQYQVDTRYEC